MRVSVVNAVCRRRDAIGEAVNESCLAIAGQRGWDCKLYTFGSDFDDVDTKIVTGAFSVLQDPFFASSNVHLFHFGFFSKLFNLLGAGRARTVRVVRFHNVTPKEFVAPEIWDAIDRSQKQIALIDEANEVWADSPYNRDDLIKYGIDPRKVLVEPLFAKPQYSYQGEKPTETFNMLYVGRFVQSKGVLDLVHAVNLMSDLTGVAIQLHLVGSQSFSDKSYIESIEQLISKLALESRVHFLGELDETELSKYYRGAHAVVIPSYHEGFCVPLVEALHAGAVPVAYASGNIPFLLEGVGEIVPVGDVEMLAARLARLADWHAKSWNDSSTRKCLPLGDTVVDMNDYRKEVAQRAETYSRSEFQKRVVNRLNILAGLS